MIKSAATFFFENKSLYWILTITILVPIFITNCQTQSQNLVDPGEINKNAIIYASQTINDNSDNTGLVNIYIINPDHPEKANIVPLPTGSSDPSWSPDKSSIAFVQTSEEGRFIYNSNTNGTEIRRLTNSHDTQPNWSPNTGNIVFTSYRSGSPGIYKIDTNGNNLEQVIDSEFQEKDPAWSAQADEILYISDVTGNFEIYSINLQTKDVSQLTNSLENKFAPNLSPNGKYLAFHSSIEDQNNLDIYTLELDTNKIQRITYDSGWDTSPEWNSAGNKLTFVSTRDGNQDIYIIELSTTKITRITKNPGSDVNPSW